MIYNYIYILVHVYLFINTIIRLFMIEKNRKMKMSNVPMYLVPQPATNFHV